MKIARTSSTLGIVQSRSRSGCDFESFLHLQQYKLLSPISQLYIYISSKIGAVLNFEYSFPLVIVVVRVLTLVCVPVFVCVCLGCLCVCVPVNMITKK